VVGGRILVVDDDTILRRSIASILEDEGYEVDHAGNGAVALAKIRQVPPDAILLDVMMPGMNGRELLEELRSDADNADIPVVMMTALQGISTDRAIELGADDMVEKPFDVEVLLNKVALALFRSNRPATPERPVHVPRAQGSEATEVPGAGVVLVVHGQRKRSMELDRALTDRGFTVVSLTRVTDELPRLARVLEPVAVVFDLSVAEPDPVAPLEELRAAPGLATVPLLVSSRRPELLREHGDALRRLRVEVVDDAAPVDALVHRLAAGH